MDILQDQNFLTVTGIVVTIIVALVIYFLQKKEKKIGYRVLSKTTLLSVEEEITKDVEILYKGDPVKQVKLIVIKLACLGKVPIEDDDYYTPISINFGKESQILSAEILEKKPEDIDISILIEDNKVVFQEGLLNQDDTLIIKVLVSKHEEEIKVEARISGIKRINEMSEQSKLMVVLFFIVIGLFTAFIISFIYSLLFLTRPEGSAILNSIMLFMVPITLIMAFISFINTRKEKKIEKKLKKLLDQTKT